MKNKKGFLKKPQGYFKQFLMVSNESKQCLMKMTTQIDRPTDYQSHRYANQFKIVESLNTMKDWLFINNHKLS